MIVHILGLALDVKTPGQLPGSGKTFLHGCLHHTPHADEIVPDLGPLIHLDVLHQIHIPVLAELQNFGKGVLHVNLLALRLLLPALYDDIAAADTLHPDVRQFLLSPQGHEIHGVGVLHILRVLFREYHLRDNGGKSILYGPVGAVAPAGL